MKSRRSRTGSTSRPTSDFALLEVGAEATRPIRLVTGQPLVLGGREGWEARLSAGDDGTVEVRASAGIAVRINEVQVHGLGRARSGDLVALPDRSLLVQRFSPKPELPPAVASHEAFELRLKQEVNEALPTRAPVSMLVVHSRALLGSGLREFLAAPEFHRLLDRKRPVLVGHAAPATLEFLCPGGTTVDSEGVREQLSEPLGRLGRPFRWGWATAPVDGLHTSTLWGRALDRLFAEGLEPAEELPHLDPVMARLWSFCDLWAVSAGGILLCGELGSGRETLGRAIHEQRTAHAPFVVVRSATFDPTAWRASVERARGGTLYVRHLEVLPSVDLRTFWDATAFRPMAGVEVVPPAVPPAVITLPPLRDRPADVLPIAEHLLARCIGIGAPHKPRFTSLARTVLERHWAGSVRELKNLMQRAALLVDTSGEVLPEHFSIVVGEGTRAHELDLRASLRTAERRTFLEALGATGWNVTETARLLGIPRRTLVYRMSKLGLKRPASG